MLACDLSAQSFVMLPKVEHDQVMSWAGQLFPPHMAILPIIESARGLHYAADLGCDLSPSALHMPRTQLLNWAAIHPTQIAVIHSALAPSATEVAHAKRVIEAFEAADQGVALLDGKLLELPVVKAARRVLE